MINNFCDMKKKEMESQPARGRRAMVRRLISPPLSSGCRKQEILSYSTFSADKP